jgi:hypothetical protein
MTAVIRQIPKLIVELDSPNLLHDLPGQPCSPGLFVILQMPTSPSRATSVASAGWGIWPGRRVCDLLSVPGRRAL